VSKKLITQKIKSKKEIGEEEKLKVFINLLNLEEIKSTSSQIIVSGLIPETIIC
jgi:hypothetical protein